MPELVHNDNEDLRVVRLRVSAADGRSRAVQAWRMSGWRKRFVAAARCYGRRSATRIFARGVASGVTLAPRLRRLTLPCFQP